MMHPLARTILSWLIKPSDIAYELHFHKIVNNLLLSIRLMPNAGPGLQHIYEKLDGLLRAMDRRLSCAVIGDFNSGKTSLVHLLARQQLFEVGHLTTEPTAMLVTTANTMSGTELSRTERRSELPADPCGLPKRFIPAPAPDAMINVIDVIDCPGFGYPGGDDIASLKLAARSDIVIWCSVATQCWKQSEHSLWDKLPHRVHRNALLVVTCADLIRSPRDMQSLTERLSQDTKDIFGEVVFVSANRAVSALSPSGRIKSRSSFKTSGARALEQGLSRQMARVRSNRVQRTRSVLTLLAHRAEKIGQAPTAKVLWKRPVAKWLRRNTKLIGRVATGRLAVAVAIDTVIGSLAELSGSRGQEKQETFLPYRSIADEITALVREATLALEAARDAATVQDAARMATAALDAFAEAFTKLQRRAKDQAEQASAVSKVLSALASYGL